MMMADRHHVLSRRIDAAVNDSFGEQLVGCGLGIEGEFEHVGGLDELRRARTRQEIPARIGRMPQAHVPEGIEHAFVRQDAARERKERRSVRRPNTDYLDASFRGAGRRPASSELTTALSSD